MILVQDPPRFTQIRQAADGRDNGPGEWALLENRFGRGAAQDKD